MAPHSRYRRPPRNSSGNTFKNRACLASIILRSNYCANPSPRPCQALLDPYLQSPPPGVQTLTIALQYVAVSQTALAAKFAVASPMDHLRVVGPQKGVMRHG